jgi:hypothetical protein
MLRKIISGGQTGADMGGLEAARELGLETGGVAPRGWLTENGPQKGLLQGFGLVECDATGYASRTRRNIELSDGTLLVGPYRSGGSKLTRDVAAKMGKPLFLLPFAGSSDETPAFRSWLEHHGIKILNVAGNRESQSPGIAEFTRRFLLNALGGPH